MTQHDFEVTVNMLLGQGRKLHAIKFMRDCFGNIDTGWIGLSDNKKMVDIATRTINTIAIPFRIIHYPAFTKKVLYKLRKVNSKVGDDYLKNSIKPPYDRI